ncbi:hypothetical protein IAT38_006035 [Cryptococcus sp. DSM 104549]
MPAAISSLLYFPSTQPSNSSVQRCYFGTEACADYVCGKQAAPVTYLANYTNWYCEVGTGSQVNTDWANSSKTEGGACANTSSLGCTQWDGGEGNTTSGAKGEMGAGWGLGKLVVVVMCFSAVVGHLA